MGSLSLADVIAVLSGGEPAHPVPIPASEETR